MKGTTLIFIILAFLTILKIMNVYPVNNWLLISIFCLWILLLYYKVHKENKQKRTPMPVYLASPQ